jgi:hypothetical protein
MAFLTASKVTSYENDGFLEMYTYEPATEKIVCVSCRPDGAPPTSNVEASNNGLFMTNDGRTFFTTSDPLVPQDTDGLRDVYEYTEGRPQLISSGTATKDEGLAAFPFNRGTTRSGLAGVSANGTDVYFSTYDGLVPQDHNGTSLRFYDARTGGGFLYSPPQTPCTAADECTGSGTSPTPAPQNGTGADLGTLGNFAPQPTPHQKHKRAKHRKSGKKSHHRKEALRRHRFDAGAKQRDGR